MPRARSPAQPGPWWLAALSWPCCCQGYIHEGLKLVNHSVGKVSVNHVQHASELIQPGNSVSSVLTFRAPVSRQAGPWYCKTSTLQPCVSLGPRGVSYSPVHLTFCSGSVTYGHIPNSIWFPAAWPLAW